MGRDDRRQWDVWDEFLRSSKRTTCYHGDVSEQVPIFKDISPFLRYTASKHSAQTSQSVCKIDSILSLIILPKCCPRLNSRVFSPTRRHSRLNSRDFIPTRTCTRSNSLDFSPTLICPRLSSPFRRSLKNLQRLSSNRSQSWKEFFHDNFLLKTTGDLDFEGPPVIALISDEPSNSDEHVPITFHWNRDGKFCHIPMLSSLNC